MSFPKRPRQEQTFRKEKPVYFAKFGLKTTHPDQAKTETRLSKIEANKTKTRLSKMLYETKTRLRVSVPLVLRLRRDQDSRPSLVGQDTTDRNSLHQQYQSFSLLCLRTDPVADGGENKFEFISQQDFLCHTKKSNPKMRKIKVEMQEKKCKVWRSQCRKYRKKKGGW